MNNSEYNSYKLKLRQSLPLEDKIRLTNNRIKQWYEHYDGKVYVAFSGGKDSTVLLHLVRNLYPDVVAVFSNTGLEYPEIVDFVKQTNNVIWLKPKKSFYEVINKYGYPVISKEQSQYISEYKTTKSDKLKNLRFNGRDNSKSGKISEKWKFLIDAPFDVSHKCCYYLKKQPFYLYEKKTGFKPYIGTMSEESRLRESSYKKHGCNAFEAKRPTSKPLSFWKEEDIWNYILINNIRYSKIYDMGYSRTGCTFCMYGCHLEKEPNKFQLMKDTHPQMHDYCINKLKCGEILDYIGVKYE